MRFRSTIERLMPVSDGEERMAPADKKLVFRGRYFKNSAITKVVKSDKSKIHRNGPKSVRYTIHDTSDITRTDKKGRSSCTYFTAPEHYTFRGAGYLRTRDWEFSGTRDGYPDSHLEYELKPFTLARANRVEKVARRIKPIAVLAVAAGLTWGGSEVNDIDRSPVQLPDIAGQHITSL